MPAPKTFTLRSPTEPEKEHARNVAGAAENVLGSAEPSMIGEVVAQLVGKFLLDHCQREDLEASALEFMRHVFSRIDAMVAEDTKLARAIVAKQQGQR